MNKTRESLLDSARSAVSIGVSIVESRNVASVSSKGDRDFVTDIDIAVQESVQSFLESETPGIGFLGEEGEDAPTRSGPFWTLDPIDGTSNLIHGIPLFGISLALFEFNSPTIGVITMPALGLEYYAAVGLGAYRNGERIHVASASELSESIVSMGDYAVGKDATKRNRPRLALTALLAERAERIRMFGTAAYDLACVADGSTDGCVILSNNPWDIAAGTVIVRESGGVVCDSDGSMHSPHSRHTIAGNSLTAKELVSLVARAHDGS
ncbi:inositol monophosphatase family protein [Nocardia sp. A7]|uniref:inositol monophosphatase family protein n=1 Tax=Nocardia sp. A7 TaxID=2789274 RepID=UPI00397AC7BF